MQTFMAFVFAFLNGFSYTSLKPDHFYYNGDDYVGFMFHINDIDTYKTVFKLAYNLRKMPQVEEMEVTYKHFSGPKRSRLGTKEKYNIAYIESNSNNPFNFRETELFFRIKGKTLLNITIYLN